MFICEQYLYQDILSICFNGLFFKNYRKIFLKKN